MDLKIFSQLNFLQALKTFFADLKVPVNYVADEPTSAKDIFKDTFKDNETFRLIDEVYFAGIVDDAAFEGNKSLEAGKIKSDYDGILIFGVTLKNRPNSLLPTRSQLAEISRAFNREFYYTPVVVVFRYGNYLAFANTERIKYKQEWREGEKAGKVSLLRDVYINKPHSGHERILTGLQINATGTRRIDSFAKLYAYWQEVFSVSLLSKKFYQELSNWYFWATQHVTFPGEPTSLDAHNKKAKLEELLQEHRATNVIRMLTRLLFVWFIKEKKLIPEELFELDVLQKDILNEISPYHERGMFKERNKESVYYKAILQNLFFATLNCPIEGDSFDKRKRGFRGEGYGTHRGIDYLMRYKQYFKKPEAFLEKLNKTVPFLNGGLFECLDDKFNNVYIDGFSDQMTKGEQLIVPDYLFFGVEEETDLSDVVGIEDKKYKQAAVKGLINILKSYKFTITENTPIEEDVALDPELLGKVFENLLASYNPETKTTARKQTGSFYTPREIVNYMVDESLIAYLKNKILSEPSVFIEFGKIQSSFFGNEGKVGQLSLMNDASGSELKNNEQKLDSLLHELVSFNPGNPFTTYPNTTKQLLKYLSECTILDPACGSGAFPMGILQKIVHILQKLDPENKVWRQVQEENAKKEAADAIVIEKKEDREERLKEISEAFDQSINDPDYARKLFLIENCIYGVDIQPIATQISKLRFFISLVVDQKVNAQKDNFGIRPLPNLETKFVAANTLIGIKRDGGLFETDEVKKLETELKFVRHKIFSLKSKERKIAWREKDKQLREKLSTVLKNQGLPLDAAEKLAGWDPYDQNTSSTFFDAKWMFNVKDGFNIVIGNPPYIDSEGMVITGNEWLRELLVKTYTLTKGNWDLYVAFFEFSFKILKPFGVLSFITPDKWLAKPFGKELREFSLPFLTKLLRSGRDVFENVGVDSIVTIFVKNKSEQFTYLDLIEGKITILSIIEKIIFQTPFQLDIVFSPHIKLLIDISYNHQSLSEVFDVKCENACSTADCYILKEIMEDGTSDSILKGDYYGIINTGTIGPFVSRWGTKEMTYIKDKFLYPVVRKLDFHKTFPNSYGAKALLPKLIIKGLTLLDASLDIQGKFVPGKSTLVITSRDSTALTVLAALLNSSVPSFYIKQRYSAASYNTGINFTKDMLNNLPVPSYQTLIRSPLKLLTQIVSKIIIDKLGFNDVWIKNVINALVFNLYFPVHMKERGINVLEFVELDISQVMRGRDFEKLIDTEKQQAIQALYAKWSHPDNEVRNRIKLFAVRSPEILKPILESR